MAVHTDRWAKMALVNEAFLGWDCEFGAFQILEEDLFFGVLSLDVIGIQ